MAPLPLVLVEWVDAVRLTSGWHTADRYRSGEAEDWRTYGKCESIGFLLKDDEEGVIVSSSASGDHVADGMFIPRGAVVATHRLRRG